MQLQSLIHIFYTVQQTTGIIQTEEIPLNIFLLRHKDHTPLLLFVLFSNHGKLDNTEDVIHSAIISPCGGSHSPISWKK